MYVLWVMSSFLVWCCCLDAKEASLALFPKNDMLSISTFFERMKPMVDKYQGSFPFSFIPYFTHTHFLAPVKSPTPNSTVTKFHSHNSQKHVGEICSDTTLPNTPPVPTYRISPALPLPQGSLLRAAYLPIFNGTSPHPRIKKFRKGKQ